MRPRRRYFLQGARDALDRAGEFWFDPVYWPLHEPIEQQEIVVPGAHRIVELVGESATRPVSHIALEVESRTRSQLTLFPKD